MINTLLFDFSRTLLFPKDSTYNGKLNDLYRSIISKKNYSFFDYFVINDDLFNYLKPLKKHYTLALYTTDIVQNDPAIKPILANLFSHIFVANDMETTKKDPNSYLLIAKTLNVEPENILFIDDQEANLKVAKEAGLQTLQFISNEQLFKELKTRL